MLIVVMMIFGVIRSGHMTMIDEPLEMNRILVEWFQKLEASTTWSNMEQMKTTVMEEL